MNPALNREASEARLAGLRREAVRDAIAIAEIRAASREPASLPASLIAAMLRLIQPRRTRRTRSPVLAADIDSVSPPSGVLRR
jgi:hypothetical protein